MRELCAVCEKDHPMGPACLKKAREKRVEEQKAKVSSYLFPFSFVLELSIYKVLYQLLQQAIINFFYRLRLRVRRKRPKDSTILILQLQKQLPKGYMFNASHPSVDGPKEKLIGLPTMDRAFTRTTEWKK